MTRRIKIALAVSIIAGFSVDVNNFPGPDPWRILFDPRVIDYRDQRKKTEINRIGIPHGGLKIDSINTGQECRLLHGWRARRKR